MTTRTLLVVDDFEPARYVRARMLERAGFRVLEAGTGQEALDAASAMPDLVLLDINLPDMNGREVCRRLKLGEATSHIPVLHISATSTEPSDQVAGLAEGADGYLTEPVDPDVLIATIRAVLRTREAERACRIAQARYRSLVEGVPAVVYQSSADGAGYHVVSPQVAAITGYTPEQVTGDPALWAAHILEEDLPRVKTALLESMFAGLPCRVEYRFRRKDGVTVWLRDESSLLRDDQGRPLGRQGIVQDVTERRALEERLRQLSTTEAVGRLAGGIAHEFNNLMTVVLGYSQLLMAQVPKDSVQHREVADVHAAAERAASLTRQLLAYSGRQPSRPRVASLNQILLETGRVLPELLGEAHTLEMSLLPELWNVKVDPALFPQVVTSLVLNARDALPSGGVIGLETRNVEVDSVRYCARGLEVPRGEYIQLSVSDSGEGMDEAARRHLFEPFFSTRPGRTGLGLASVHGIVQQAGGYLQVETAPGRGTAVRVLLPREAAPVEPPSPVANPLRPIGALRSVLVVDDEELVRALIRDILVACGYEVVEATDGRSALDVLGDRRRAIDLLITDIRMPGMRGAELAEHALRLRPDLPVVFVSGYSHDDGCAPGRDFLLKPFTPAALAEKVREVLGRTARGGNSLP